MLAVSQVHWKIKMSLSKLLLRLSQGGSDVSNSFQIKLFNGISDIGGLDFYASEQLIVQNVGYGEFSEYFDISTQTDEIVVKESGTKIIWGHTAWK
ncbi:hypothetical protein Ct9H90mP29_16540 [bacterium]|nr:MAG: hypothetical protein Ct9H90mP29_16540 [bacterium]